MGELERSDPSAVGLDAGRLGNADRHIASYIAQGRLPGAILLIGRRGAIAHLSVQGEMDRARRRALTEETIFRIYSMTKPLTSVALMMLYEEGRFQLDDPVAKFIPALSDLKVYDGGHLGRFATRPPEREVTIRDLLTHMSGLTYGFQERTPVDAAYRSLKIDDSRLPLDAWIDRLATLPLEFDPGLRWNYSVSTDVLGYLIERLSGLPLDTFLRQRLFDPLDLRDTDFFVPSEKSHRLAALYHITDKAPLELLDDPQTSRFLKRPVFLSGGGGLVSTARDYARFAQMLCDGGRFGGRRFLSRKTFDLMRSNHLPNGGDLHTHSVSLFSETAMAGIGFGLGFAVMMDPAKSQIPGTPGEIAWGGAANTYFWVDPVEQLFVVFLTQLLPSRLLNIRRELRTLVYSALVD